MVVTDELLGKGGFGDVFLADLNGRNAAAKVRSPFHLPPGRGHSCEPRRPVSGDHMSCLGGRSSVETWLVDFGNPKKLAAFLRGCRCHDLVSTHCIEYRGRKEVDRSVVRGLGKHERERTSRTGSSCSAGSSASLSLGCRSFGWPADQMGYDLTRSVIPPVFSIDFL